MVFENLVLETIIIVISPAVLHEVENKVAACRLVLLFTLPLSKEVGDKRKAVMQRAVPY
jgi:hypothetical protein